MLSFAHNFQKNLNDKIKIELAIPNVEFQSKCILLYVLFSYILWSFPIPPQPVPKEEKEKEKRRSHILLLKGQNDMV